MSNLKPAPIRLSFVDMLPQSMRNAIMVIPMSILTKNEDELRAEYKVTTKDVYIKAGLWLAYEHGLATNESRIPMEALTPFLPRHQFEEYISNPVRLAWLISPPVSNSIQLHAMFSVANERLMEALNPPADWQVGPDATKYARVFMNIWKELHVRLFGAPEQSVRIRTKNESLNLNINTDKVVDQQKTIKDVAELDKQIEQLKIAMNMIPAPHQHPEQEMKDVTPEEEDAQYDSGPDENE